MSIKYQPINIMGPRLYGGGLYGEGLYGVTLPITATYPLIKGGGGGGVQAYNFGNFDYEIRVEGEGQDTSRLF